MRIYGNLDEVLFEVSFSEEERDALLFPAALSAFIIKEKRFSNRYQTSAEAMIKVGG